MSAEIRPSRPSKDRSLKQVVEVKDKATGVAKQAALFAGAGLLAYAGVLVLFAAVVLGLIAIGVAAWLATLSVAILVLLGAFLLVQRARGPKDAT